MATSLRSDPDLNDGRPFTGLLECVDSTGDTKLTWDRDNPDEVENARQTFKRLTKDRKYTAFRTDRQGAQGTRMAEFDVDAERMILIPQYQGG